MKLSPPLNFNLNPLTRALPPFKANLLHVGAMSIHLHSPPPLPKHGSIFCVSNTKSCLKGSSLHSGLTPLSQFTSFKMTFKYRPTFYPSFMPSLLSTTYSPPFHTQSLSPFSFPINPHHNPSIKAYVDGPRASPHTSTTTPSRPPLSSYSFTRIITSHFNPSFTLATAAHLPTTQFNLAYSFNLPYFTFCGQPLMALSTVLRLLNSSTSQNTLPIGPTTCPTTSWR